MLENRNSGILFHITSIPSPYGIGTFGKEAYEFVDFLEKSGQKNWQILPIGPTSFGDSPYMSFSSFAGNPYFIDLDILNKKELISKKDYINEDFGDNIEEVDYEKIFDKKTKILRIAYNNARSKYKNEILQFKEENKDWIDDYSLYMALKDEFKLKPWQEWDEDIKLREEEALKFYRRKLENEINYHIFIQYEFFNEWKKLKKYANDKDIKIIGDIPIYVAADSSDTWANSEIFLLDNKNNPKKVAGCPPDAFSETGQLWGNPLYNWDLLEKQNYDWWIKRIKGNINLYDMIRIDHFRGFESFWSIPYGDKTALNGKWVKGPGMKFFNALKKELGHIEIIAEDLGYLTRETIRLKEDSGYPGMKVLQFAFDTREESDYLPHNYNKYSVVYTGTHDNDTINGWFLNAAKEDVKLSIDYLKLTKEEGYNWGFIRGAWSSVSNLAIAQMQDFLALESWARMNTPSTLGGNWKWRMKKESLTESLAYKIRNMTKLYGRL
ncbi:4-alpha-glucanotransferase [Senegalia sp. (in: firmicutes)]|uniref:4-alpha-glucanotransferase n=1 Tax=Senegalia sp. (in: firmicutes) TaxID=1924098 RepID=UPI003F947A52